MVSINVMNLSIALQKGYVLFFLNLFDQEIDQFHKPRLGCRTAWKTSWRYVEQETCKTKILQCQSQYLAKLNSRENIMFAYLRQVISIYRQNI